jgi:hypothetical protein
MLNSHLFKSATKMFLAGFSYPPFGTILRKTKVFGKIIEPDSISD